jgi:hypothetical protein
MYCCCALTGKASAIAINVMINLVFIIK